MADEAATPNGMRTPSDFTSERNKRKRAIEAARSAMKQRDDAVAELAKLKERAADAAKLQAEVEAAKTELRITKHRRVADEVLREAGIDPKAIDAFYKLADLKFEGDEPDAAKLKASILAEKEKPGISNLFQPASGQASIVGEEGTSNSSPGPAPGRGQGGNERGASGPFQATRDQLRDPAWCFAHQDEIRKAAAQVIDMPTGKTPEKFVVLG